MHGLFLERSETGQFPVLKRKIHMKNTEILVNSMLWPFPSFYRGVSHKH